MYSNNHVTFTAKSENIKHNWIGDLVEETGASGLRLNSSDITRAPDAMDQSNTEKQIFISSKCVTQMKLYINIILQHFYNSFTFKEDIIIFLHTYNGT